MWLSCENICTSLLTLHLCWTFFPAVDEQGILGCTFPTAPIIVRRKGAPLYKPKLYFTWENEYFVILLGMVRKKLLLKLLLVAVTSNFLLFIFSYLSLLLTRGLM